MHLPASPLMHGTGQFSTLQALFLGGTIVTLESRHFDPAGVVADRAARTASPRSRSSATRSPSRCSRALEEADARGEPYDLSSLVLVISSGVMWSESVKRALIERHPVIAYDSLGSSEGVGFANAITSTDSKGETAKFSVGPDTKVFTDDGREVKPGSGEVGYLAVGGHIPLGYYKDPEKTAATFRVVDGKRYSIPGDYATVEADGTITLLGRGSVSINSGGEKIFPEEVEEAVKQHPAVADAVVVGVPDERFGEAVTAVVSLAPGRTAGEDEITGAVERSGLARFKRPKHVVVVDAVHAAPTARPTTPGPARRPWPASVPSPGFLPERTSVAVRFLGMISGE